jgi:hypothetical protein
MQKVTSILIIAIMLVMASATASLAQRKSVRTSSAMAAYGVNPVGASRHKKVKKKSSHNHQRAERKKQRKAQRATDKAYRKKNTWAG